MLDVTGRTKLLVAGGVGLLLLGLLPVFLAPLVFEGGADLTRLDSEAVGGSTATREPADRGSGSTDQPAPGAGSTAPADGGIGGGAGDAGDAGDEAAGGDGAPGSGGDGATPADRSPGLDVTPDPSTRAALAGTAEVRDPTGDVGDTAGMPPADREPAVDLVRVRLEGDDDRLTILWEVAGPVPSAADFLLWSLDLWSDDELASTITIQQDGARRVAGVLDWSTGAQIVLPDGPEVSGSTLRLVVPLGALPRLEGRITWSALGQVDGGFEDRAPQDGRADFPS